VLCRCTGYRKIIDAVQAAGAETVDRTGRPCRRAIRRLDGAARSSAPNFSATTWPRPTPWSLRVIRSPFIAPVSPWAISRGGPPGIRAIVAVLTAADIPGRNRFGVIPGFADQPVFAEGETALQGRGGGRRGRRPPTRLTLDETAFPVAWDADAPRPDDRRGDRGRSRAAA
jgi:aldehyde oxidoreductase